jgi:Zn-dependent M28 family amino/carboxypeptidase
MINLDMVGVGDRLAFGGDGVLIEPALRAAAGLGTNAGRMRGGAGSSSDHASFQAAGIPSLFVYRGEDPNYHSAGDQARQVSPDHLATAGNVVLAVLDDLAAGAR